MTADQARVSRGEVVGGQYELERVLGQGGMGTVWSACDLRLGRTVAIKFLGASAMKEPLQRERFAREARMASRIRSPHVAQIIADGMTNAGIPFVVMELLDGESLAAHLARLKRCSLAAAGNVLEQVCRALGSAHVVGVVHRDIKPANIFLSPQSGADVFVRLLDFGIAKELRIAHSRLTLSGEVLGTADYMSPEQLRTPEEVGAAADIWSLGVVLYEMLTGEVPFGARTFPDVAIRIASGKFRAPSEVCSDVPAAVDAVIARALSAQPSQRFSTVEEFASKFLRIVRAHTSESVIRPDVMRVLRAQDGDLHATSTLRTQLFDGTSKRSVIWSKEWFGGVLLIVVCLLSLAAAWLLTGSSNGTASTPASLVEPTPLLPTSVAAPQPQPVTTIQLDVTPPAAHSTETSVSASIESRIVPPPAASPQPRRRRHAESRAKATTPAAHTSPAQQPDEAARPGAPSMKETKYGF